MTRKSPCVSHNHFLSVSDHPQEHRSDHRRAPLHQPSQMCMHKQEMITVVMSVDTTLRKRVLVGCFLCVSERDVLCVCVFLWNAQTYAVANFHVFAMQSHLSCCGLVGDELGL